MYNFIHDYLIERKFKIVETDNTIDSVRYRRFFFSTKSDSEKQYSDVIVNNNSVMVVETIDTPKLYDSMMIARGYRVDTLEQLKFLLNNNTSPILSYFKKTDNVSQS